MIGIGQRRTAARRAAVTVVALLMAAPLATPLRAAPAQVTTLPDTSAITPEMIQAGRTIFHGAGTCFACHGAQLEGAVGPTLRAHKWKDAANGELPEIYRVITHGVPGTMMVAHPAGISDEAAVKVAVYIWSVSHGKAKP